MSTKAILKPELWKETDSNARQPLLRNGDLHMNSNIIQWRKNKLCVIPNCDQIVDLKHMTFYNHDEFLF